MYKTLSPLFLVLLVSVSIAGLVATSEAFKPQSPDEEAITTALKDHETALNNHDVEGSMAIYHEEAQIMTLDRRMHSKEEFADVLLDAFNWGLRIQVRIRKITVTGDQAIVKSYVNTTQGGREITERCTYSMVRVNNKWLVLKSVF